jgi:hypothetical protein
MHVPAPLRRHVIRHRSIIACLGRRHNSCLVAWGRSHLRGDLSEGEASVVSHIDCTLSRSGVPRLRSMQPCAVLVQDDTVAYSATVAPSSIEFVNYVMLHYLRTPRPARRHRAAMQPAAMSASVVGSGVIANAEISRPAAAPGVVGTDGLSANMPPGLYMFCQAP